MRRVKLGEAFCSYTCSIDAGREIHDEFPKLGDCVPGDWKVYPRGSFFSHRKGLGATS